MTIAVVEQLTGCKTGRRCPGWDYTTPGAYFVTICTHQRRNYFGAVNDEKVRLNRNGQIAESCWKGIPSHHRDVELDEFVIMPNHVHGILVITDDDDPEKDSVAALHATPLQSDSVSEAEYFSGISPKKGSLSAIIRSYKSAVTKLIHKDLDPTFAWQARFYDHIIRSEHDLENLRLYISLNPENFHSDAQHFLEEASAHA